MAKFWVTLGVDTTSETVEIIGFASDFKETEGHKTRTNLPHVRSFKIGPRQAHEVLLWFESIGVPEADRLDIVTAIAAQIRSDLERSINEQ